MSRLSRIFLIFSIALIIFSIGYVIGSDNFPFSKTIKATYQNMLEQNNTNYDEINKIHTKTTISNLVDIQNEIDVISHRNNLIEFIWKKQNLPINEFPTNIEYNIIDKRYSSLSNLKEINKISTVMENGVESHAYLFIPNLKNQSLVIYHQGHDGDFVNGIEIIDSLLENNISVLAFSMPLLGMNNQPEVELENIGIIKLQKHDNFYFLDNQNFSSIKYFVHPITLSLNHIIETYDYDEFHMIGISGGGFVTSLYSALDNRIMKSFSIASPLPLFISINSDDHESDYESTLPELYRIVNHMELYILSSYGENREHLKIINKYDPCCHYGISYQLFENDIMEIMEKLDNGSFSIFLDTTHTEHKISEEAKSIIFNSIST